MTGSLGGECTFCLTRSKWCLHQAISLPSPFFHLSLNFTRVLCYKKIFPLSNLTQQCYSINLCCSTTVEKYQELFYQNFPAKAWKHLLDCNFFMGSFLSQPQRSGEWGVMTGWSPSKALIFWEPWETGSCVPCTGSTLPVLRHFVGVCLRSTSGIWPPTYLCILS